MACQITNNSNLDISGFEDTIQQLVSFSQDRFGFEKPPALFLNSDPSNAANPLGKTAYYDPEKQEIHIYVDERHPKDIMRSISHELIHHVQNLRGDLSGNHYHGEGYAQKDKHMREMEREAYEEGNMCFRDFEDLKRENKTTYNEWRTNKMSLKEWKNNELFTLLSDKWGFGKNTITEAKGDVDPNMPIDALKKQLEDAGIDTTGMSAKDMDKKAAMLRLGNPEKYTALEEELEEMHCPSGKKDDELEEGAKPDFLDLDGDGDKEEPMKKAAEDKEAMDEEMTLDVDSEKNVPASEMDELDEMHCPSKSKKDDEDIRMERLKKLREMVKEVVQEMLDE